MICKIPIKKNGNIFFLLLIGLLLGCSNDQLKSKEEIIGKWILVNNIWSDTLKFKKNSIIAPEKTWLSEFNFMSNTLEHQYLKTTPRCGNGIITFDSCGWTYYGEQIEVYVKYSTISYNSLNHTIYRQIPLGVNDLYLVKDSVLEQTYEDSPIFKF